ncbi:hypothetical protein B0T26DRAFT_758050 [Lasiosphaeria miniovina]|uniref:Uncharacterized protein n=1 Tax=Lasiosphaeria miniovina TaxID=1954250 RepID=A0AA39ZR59_9PEZI|nr:uncharacterized protein B0T26DRAFT_758050 [Lasiosphaeria miniovina]KAK0702101.1 hypothetical protein B0T26DRAFT_758050 [Lasiosphaeria miniovina]
MVLHIHEKWDKKAAAEVAADNNNEPGDDDDDSTPGVVNRLNRIAVDEVPIGRVPDEVDPDFYGINTDAGAYVYRPLQPHGAQGARRHYKGFYARCNNPSYYEGFGHSL